MSYCFEKAENKLLNDKNIKSIIYYHPAPSCDKTGRKTFYILQGLKS
jgi:hypothetical protein